VRDLTAACFDRLVPCIEGYGGTFDKFVGDEVMALFGAPSAHEDDPERALGAALAMRAALAAFNAERGLDLALHMGINTGVVFAGSVGSAGHLDYSVMGDPVNLAARLVKRARPGQVIVGPDTHRLARGGFRFRSAGALGLKGKVQPVQSLELVGAEAGGIAAGSPLSRAVRSHELLALHRDHPAGRRDHSG
jgi:class 3 adenylate cyclase